ncbi:JmjC domain-containing protein [Stappia sp. ES.058]|uniref:JmjC domain-containing protein n=1 Tax=Stappia sp. ES.058 TaxID=1881061 RepID=UPI00087AF55B|nr:cupin domain-containing protein [Stappia sp. ES.058]SDU31218.1 Cupin superfamily protein [Stappia sp. ES.058]
MTVRASTPAEASASLASLLAPLSVEEFFADHYEKAPLHLTGKSVAERYPGFPDIEGFEHLLWSQEEKLRRVLRVNRRGSYFAMPHPSQGKSLFRWSVDRLADGCTLILNGMDTMSVPVARVARTIEAEFGGKVAANGFLTPTEQQGFLAHFDTHDVFILQLEGTKRWPLFDQRLELPIDRQIHLIDQASVGEPTAVFDLEPGDLLYVPRGLVHGPHTLQGHSFHLTMGFRPLRWVDYLSALVQVAAEQDPAFRSSILQLDGEAFDALCAEKLARLAETGGKRRPRKLAMERLMESLGAQLRPLPGEHIRVATRAEEIDADTQVLRRPECPCHVYEKDGAVRIQFPGIGLATDEDLQPGCIEAPLVAGGALRWIARSHAPFCARDLPEPLDIDARVDLVRMLARNGLLTLCPPA